MPEPNYPVELTPPDIEPYRAGNTGVEYVTTLDSGVAGPHVLVTALTHGNEICGAIALDRLLRAGLRPRRGRLTLAFDNVAAYHSFDPRYPIASRFVDEDFNRLWDAATLDGARQIGRARPRPRAAAVRRRRRLPARHPFDAARDRAADAGRACSTGRSRAGAPGRHPRADHVRRRPRRRQADARLRRRSATRPRPKTALLIEAGQHWVRRTAEVAIDVMLRFLVALGIVAQRGRGTARRPRFRRPAAPARHRGHRGGDDHRRPVRIRRRFPRARSADAKGYADRPRRRRARCAPPMTIAC